MMMSESESNKSAGLTLVELVIAIAMIGLISVLMSQSLLRIQEGYNRVKSEADVLSVSYLIRTLTTRATMYFKIEDFFPSRTLVYSNDLDFEGVLSDGAPFEDQVGGVDYFSLTGQNQDSFSLKLSRVVASGGGGGAELVFNAVLFARCVERSFLASHGNTLTEDLNMDVAASVAWVTSGLDRVPVVKQKGLNCCQMGDFDCGANDDDLVGRIFLVRVNDLRVPERIEVFPNERENEEVWSVGFMSFVNDDVDPQKVRIHLAVQENRCRNRPDVPCLDIGVESSDVNFDLFKSYLRWRNHSWQTSVQGELTLDGLFFLGF